MPLLKKLLLKGILLLLNGKKREAGRKEAGSYSELVLKDFYRPKGSFHCVLFLGS